MSGHTQCPEKKHCENLAGPIGMYHCNHCGQMLLAGEDPTGLCPVLNKDNWVGPDSEYDTMLQELNEWLSKNANSL